MEDNMKLKVIVESSDEGGFTVYVPSLPGCISEGNTKEEALENIREAIELYLDKYVCSIIIKCYYYKQHFIY
jgi:predicted RNase H-like HicB family nuclease